MFDSTTVDQIVANVLKQLSAGGMTAPVAQRPSAPDQQQKSSPAVPNPQSSTISLSDRVITGDLLAEKAQGASQIVVPDKAILTPTAHDFIKSAKVQIIRASAAAAKLPTTASAPGITSWKLITVTGSPAVSRVAGELGASWSREILGCPDDAATLAISSICRGEVGGVVILARQHYRAACRANRNDKVRAVPVANPADVQSAREQLRLNCIAIDPTGRSYFELKNTINAFTGAK